MNINAEFFTLAAAITAAGMFALVAIERHQWKIALNCAIFIVTICAGYAVIITTWGSL